MHDGVVEFPDTPPIITKAIREAAETRFCKFTSGLVRCEQSNNFIISASISSDRKKMREASEWFEVKFFIPKSFPYIKVETAPIKPEFKWNPHQNGDWNYFRDDRKNIICPPSENDICIEELLLPYIRHAYRWIIDAKEKTLVKDEQRYEMPHMYDSNKKIVLIEGNSDRVLNFVKENTFGIADIAQPDGCGEYLYEVTKLYGSSNGSILEFNDPFPENKRIKTKIPWVYWGNPVAGPPHRPIQTLKDLSEDKKIKFSQNIKEFYKKLRKSRARKSPLNIVLVAFNIPTLWKGEDENIVWMHFCGKLSEDTEIHWNKCEDISEKSTGIRSENNLFKDKKILVVGVGSLGSVFVDSLSKFWFKELYLIDRDKVKPGNLIRHTALKYYLGQNKAESLAKQLQGVPKKNIFGYNFDIRNTSLLPQEKKDVFQNIDIIFNFTASEMAEEVLFKSDLFKNVILISGYIKSGANFGVLHIRGSNKHTTLREAESYMEEKLSPELLEKFHSEEHEVFPEPGCYDPTFSAPYYKIRAISDIFISIILDCLKKNTCDIIFLVEIEDDEQKIGMSAKIVTELKV